MRVLIAVDGSAHALRAVEHVLQLRAKLGDLDVHLLNVQIPVESGHVRLFVGHDQLEDYYREEGLAALRDAQAALQQLGQPCTTHIAVGHIAETIARYAGEMGFDQIVVGSHGRSGVGHLLLGSVAADVIKRSAVPVTVVR
ncbi:universal stress protein [Crenobacter cavernae]|nr:universal stress protein [Crenobacter cavernae]